MFSSPFSCVISLSLFLKIDIYFGVQAARLTSIPPANLLIITPWLSWMSGSTIVYPNRWCGTFETTLILKWYGQGIAKRKAPSLIAVKKVILSERDGCFTKPSDVGSAFDVENAPSGSPWKASSRLGWSVGTHETGSSVAWSEQSYRIPRWAVFRYKLDWSWFPEGFSSRDRWISSIRTSCSCTSFGFASRPWYRHRKDRRFHPYTWTMTWEILSR